MRKAKIPDATHQPIIAGFTREDFERLNRVSHAKNLRSVIQSTKWLNDHGAELLRQHPQEFWSGTGMTVEEYREALAVHVNSCRAFLKKM
jgi:hypothetical protein